ncbi:hypothetical protein EI77_04777 [Prosthecobacter fusiformis]|uniref:Uncharacterized protein n=1 Tax=Prosthecobacter fusiformis TaxID=48464 RepID=A0A4R7RJR2_9BACT|nr:hypothetical protein [Prosthecobacter fusiformis]TDU62069.1 hypothetical protein EI77_04777 [Prosthecobacter fusiformis]
MIKRSNPSDDAVVEFSFPKHPNGLPVHLRPELWLDLYIRNGLPKSTFITKLMVCSINSDIAATIKHLPLNLFDDFKEALAVLSDVEREEDFVIVGSTPSPLRLQDVQRVIHWLEENPNPELAPPVED